MWGLKLDPFLGDLRQLEQRYHLEPATVLQGNTGMVINLGRRESAPGSIACMGKTAALILLKLFNDGNEI